MVFVRLRVDFFFYEFVGVNYWFEEFFRLLIRELLLLEDKLIY